MYCPKCPHKITMLEDYRYQKDGFNNMYGGYHDIYELTYECPQCGTEVETSIPVTITIGDRDNDPVN